MKILILCPHFEPDLHAATGEVMTQLVYALADRGHQVSVITSLPWYREHDVEPDWRGRLWRRERTEFGSIVRLWPFPTNKSNLVARALGFGGFNLLAIAAGLMSKNPNVVLAMSPPIVIADAGWLAAKRFGVPFVFNVQDIFPDVAVELGMLTNPRVIGAAERYERSVYARSDAVTVLSQDQASNVQAKLEQAGVYTRVEIIHNFVDLDRVQVVEPNPKYKENRGLGDRFVVGYAGNVGLSQSFDLVRAAAVAFADEPRIVFLVNGEGAGRPEVDGWADDLDNVVVGDFVPREEISDLLGAIDLHLVLLKEGLAASSTPSKLYGIMAAGRPILASIDAGSEVALTIERADCGTSVAPDDPEAFIAALRKMLDNRSELIKSGLNGRSFVESWMGPNAQARAYEKLFTELIESR